MKKGDFIHFVGIGGVSMSGIAMELARQGFNVSGSDASSSSENYYLKEIENFGQIRLFDNGHDAENIDPNTKYMVVTSTVSENNPEVIRAKELGIKILQRFEAVNLIVKAYKYRIGIFGGAGKTTTTALTFFLFQNAGLLPSLFLGSVMKNLKSSVHIEKKKDFCIFETDESDASFREMEMNAGIFVAMEKDHLEHNFYNGSYDTMKDCFKNLLLKLKSYDAPICYNEDSKEVVQMVEDVLSDYQNKKSFSILNKKADFYANNFKFVVGGMSFDVYKHGKLFIESVFMPLIGQFNALNVLGGIAMLSFYKTAEVVKSAILTLRSFDGIDKRQSKVGKFKNFEIIDDYAHSPLKISSMLEGFTSYAKAIDAGVLAVCEVHKVSRFEGMYDAFLTSFKSLKFLVLMDVYKVAGYNAKEPNMIKFIEDIKKQTPEIEIIYIPNKYLTKGLYQLLKREEFIKNNLNYLLFFGAGLSSKFAKNIENEFEKIHAKERN
jgi:UDP-N-acetylmuramate--alanine ligase